MNRSIQVEFQNSEFDRQLLERFIFAVDGLKTKTFVVEKPMTADLAREYLCGMCESTFYKLVKTGSIKQHFLPGCSTPFYLPSELYKVIESN